MKPTSVAKNLSQAVLEPLETIHSQLTKPVLEEAGRELGFGSIWGQDGGLGKNPREIAAQDLKRARKKQELDELAHEDNQKSREWAEKVQAIIQRQYKEQELKTSQEQHQLKEEVGQLQEEVVKLASAAGVETKVHLQPTGKKVGVLDIKRLTTIIRFLRLKADQSKSAQELVAQRNNAKRTTGMLAWVSGKQMKVHEQGTLHLQG